MEVFVKPSFVAAIQDADARVFGNRLMEPAGHEILFHVGACYHRGEDTVNFKVG